MYRCIYALLTIPISLILLIFSNNYISASWSPSHTQWTKMKNIPVINKSGDNLTANTTVAVIINTKELVDTGKLQSDCDDLRVVYQSGSVTKELDRYISYPGGGTCNTSEAAKIHFPLQENLDNDSTSNSYYIYYGNSEATTPPNPDNAFDIGTKEAILVCPFDGTTTCTAGETPLTETGPIRYSGYKTGLNLKGNIYSQYSITLGSNSSLSNLPTNELTIEWWQYPVNDGSYDLTGPWNFWIISKNSGCNGWRIGLDKVNKSINIDVGYNSRTAQTSTVSNSFSLNSWSHVAVTHNPVTKLSKVFINGVEAGYSSSTSGLGDYAGESGDVSLGDAGCNAGRFNGILDEIRISNTIRYNSSFTPQTTPFVRDEFTKLLLHLDENGKDPRITNKIVYDDSGYGNHGSISGAYSYASGLIGVDNGTNDNGKVEGSNSYAGHEGIFLEESTTNKITNPSFENSTYNTNWTPSSTALMSVNTHLLYRKFGSKSAKIDSGFEKHSYYEYNSEQGLYSSSSTKRLAQGFKVSSSFSPSYATLYLRRTGSTSRYIQVEIDSDNSGVPSNNPITNGKSNCLSYSSVNTSEWSDTSNGTRVNFTFDTPPSLESSTQYHLVLKTYTDSGCNTEQSSVDSSIYINWQYFNSNRYANGSKSAYNESGNWSSTSTQDFFFILSKDISLLTSINVGNTNTHTLSAFLYRYNFKFETGNVINSNMAKLIINDTPVDTTYTDLGDGWWRLSASASGINGPANYGVQVLKGHAFYVDGFQLEEKNAPTSYTDGSLGNGYSWNGSVNESASDRANSVLEYASSGNISSSKGTLSFWFKLPYQMSVSGRPDGIYPGLFNTSPSCWGCNYPLAIWSFDGGSNFVMTFGDNTNWGRIISNVNPGEWNHIVVTWNGRNAISYANAGNMITYTSSVDVDFSKLALGISRFNSYGTTNLSDLRIYNDELTSSEITDLYYSGLLSQSKVNEINRVLYSLTYSAGNNGSISGITHQSVVHGLDGTTVTAIANSGFHFVDWSDGSTNNPRVDVNITGDISVTANFAPDTTTHTSTSTTSSPNNDQCTNQEPGSKAPWIYAATANDSTNVTLYFTSAENPVDSYVLEYGTKSGNYTYGVQNLKLNDQEKMIYEVNSLLPNKTYFFRIRGGNGCATGPWSNEISATTKSLISFNQLNTYDLEVEEKETDDACQQYTVKSGDTLWKIAQNILGDATEYKRIIDNNKDTYPQLATSEILQVGWELKINCEENLKNDVNDNPDSEYHLSVKVIDVNNNPVEGAMVTLHSAPRTAITNKDGIASFENVESGEHKVQIAYQHYEGEQTINLTGSNTQNINLNITIEKKPFLMSSLTYIIFGIMSVVIILMGLKIYRMKK